LNESIFIPNYVFYANNEFSYQIPDSLDHAKFVEYIDKMPGGDQPPIFGLHSNADLTFRKKESNEMISTLLDTQPKESSGSGGKSREEEVKDRLEKDLIPSLPQDYIMLDIMDRLRNLKCKGLGEPGKYDKVPLNNFLR
jgi:dynein heavy chain